MTITYHSHQSLFWSWKGTVLPRVWKLTLFTGFLSLMLAYVFDEHRRMVKRGFDKTVVHHLFSDAEAFFGMATTFVTFILGFFNANVYTRWWKLRELVGTVMGKSNDTVLMLSTYVDDDSDSARRTVKELKRHLGLALALLHMAARGEDKVEDLDELCKRPDAAGNPGYLLQKGSAEYKALASCTCGKYNIVYGWFMIRTKQLLKRKELDYMPDTAMYMINMNISVMRGAAADVMMYRNTPIPMAYTHLLEVFVKVYVLIAPVALVPVLLWMAPPVAMLVTFFFYGFLKLGRMMFNPFKDEADSFPTADYLEDTITCMDEMTRFIAEGSPGGIEGGYHPDRRGSLVGTCSDWQEVPPPAVAAAAKAAKPKAAKQPIIETPARALRSRRANAER